MLAVAAPAYSQNGSEKDFQTWMDISGYRRLSTNLQLGLEGGYRPGGESEASGLSWSTGFVRSALRVDIHTVFFVEGGFGIFHRFRNQLPDSYEMRPWMGGYMGWPRLGPLTICHRVLVELQNFHFRSAVKPFTMTRFRYRIGTTIPLQPGRKKSFYFPVEYEFFRHLQDTPTQKDRLTAGLGYYLTDSLRIETSFATELIHSTLSHELVRIHHILRIRLRF